MKKIIKIIIGIIVCALGVGAMLLGVYLPLGSGWQALLGITAPFVCVGFLMIFLGYDLAKGRSIKDDFYFIFFS